MIYEFKLPDIGEGVVEGEVVRWLVREGDIVCEDQPLVEIMTDKATVEIPAPRAGRVARRWFGEGQICPVGRVLITLETDVAGGGASEAAPEAASSAPVVRVPAVGGDAAAATSGAGSGAEGQGAEVGGEGAAKGATPAGVGASAKAEVGNGARPREPRRVLATPGTRKLARDLGVDLREVVASGNAGRVTSDDVRAHEGGAGAGTAAAASKVAAHVGAAVDSSSWSSPASPASSHRATTETAEVRIPFRGIRKKIAERLAHSKHAAAHFTYVEEVDCSDLVSLREKANRRLDGRGVKLSYLPFIVKATAAALESFPQLNATLDEAAGEILQHGHRHIGLATATDQGLVVPVIRDAGQKSLVELAREIQRLSELTRAGKASREELSGSTFTITSLGALGGILATPIINFPEAAILGVHKIARRPMADGKRVVVRDMMNLSISVDHRIVDGYEAARFVAEIKSSLENPGLMFLDSI